MSDPDSGDTLSSANGSPSSLRWRMADDPIRPVPPALPGPPLPEGVPPEAVRPGSAGTPRDTIPLKRTLPVRPVRSSDPVEIKDNIRETIETVVFVVVLVLLLKTFLAEAFVIPTGSMATTLLRLPQGHHLREVRLRIPRQRQPVGRAAGPGPARADLHGALSQLRISEPRQGSRPMTMRRRADRASPPLVRWLRLRWLVVLFAVAGVVGCTDPNWSSGDRVLVAKTPWPRPQDQAAGAL